VLQEAARYSFARNVRVVQYAIEDTVIALAYDVTRSVRPPCHFCHASDDNPEVDASPLMRRMPRSVASEEKQHE
jgi:hypothetical protein